MTTQPDPESTEEMQRKADDFARRQHEDTFKRFERLLKPFSKSRENDPSSLSEDS